MGEDPRQMAFQPGDEDQPRVGHLIGHQRDDHDERQHDRADFHQTREPRDVEHADDAGDRIDLADRQRHDGAQRRQQVDRDQGGGPPENHLRSALTYRQELRTHVVRGLHAEQIQQHRAVEEARHGEIRDGRLSPAERRRRSVVDGEEQAGDEDRQGQRTVDDEDHVHDLLARRQFGQRQTDDGPQDHQLQDDARRQPELGVKGQQQQLQHDRGRRSGVEDHRYPRQISADEAPSLPHGSGGPDVHAALTRPQIAEFDHRHTRWNQERQDAQHPHRDRRPTPAGQHRGAGDPADDEHVGRGEPERGHHLGQDLLGDQLGGHQLVTVGGAASRTTVGGAASRTTVGGAASRAGARRR